MILISDLNYFTQGGSVVSAGPSSASFPSSNLTDQHPYKFTRFESVDMQDTFIKLEWTRAGRPRVCYLADYGEPGIGAEVRLRLDSASIDGSKKVAPSAIISTSNYPANLATVQADPYDFAPSASLQPISSGGDSSITVSLPPPGQDLKLGEKLQAFVIQLRRSGMASASPVSVGARVFEGGALRGNLWAEELEDEEWRLVVVPWDASILANPNGADVRLMILGGSNGADGLELGGVAWYQETVRSHVYDSGWQLLPRSSLELLGDLEPDLWGGSSALDVGPLRRGFAFPDLGELTTDPKHARLDFRLRPTVSSGQSWNIGSVRLGPAYSPNAQNWTGQLSTRAEIPESLYTTSAAPSQPVRVLEFGFEAMPSRDALILHERLKRAANSGQAVLVHAIPDEPGIGQSFAVLGKLASLADWAPFARGQRHTLTGYALRELL